jgi:hypothetical protein
MRPLTIAVSAELAHLKEFLTGRGHNVVPPHEDNLAKADAVILSGMEQNTLGIHDTTTRVPVLDARGKNPEELLSEVEHRVRFM